MSSKERIIGITLKSAPGFGDKLIMTSFPENYYANTGQKLVDMDNYWGFDRNPYTYRLSSSEPVDEIIDPFSFYITGPRLSGQTVHRSVAERLCDSFGLKKCVLRHPSLYYKDELNRKFSKRTIAVHASGSDRIEYASGESFHRALSLNVLNHILEKYRSSCDIVQVGSMSDPVFRSFLDMRSDDPWATVAAIARCDEFIGVCSGPSWIAACYPDIHCKKVLTQYSLNALNTFVLPLMAGAPNLHWLDYGTKLFNQYEEDAGVTYSYKKL